MNCFDDLNFRMCIHRFCNSDQLNFKPHANSVEFIRNGQVFLKHQDHVACLKAPVLFWLKKGEIYSFILDRKCKQPYEHLYSDCNGEKTDQMIEHLNELCPQGYVTPNNPDKISEIFFEQVKLFRLDPNYYQPEMYQNFISIVAEIVCSLRKTITPENDPYKVTLLANDMRKDPFQKYNLRAWAKKQGITYQHFRRLFRQEHKLPPAQYLRNQKMTRAAELLSMTNMRIKEIAFNCHYDSLMDFSRSFKKFAGVSPLEYRKKRITDNTIFIDEIIPDETDED
ncbi:MAG: helix-turn-helix transcriptional regulator [Lentisphaeria bacterium]|nr:helix-turn-helix transcriptional regulator [Lentisphaeria bacterium]